MEVECQVSRKYKDIKINYFALRFTKIAPEDFRFLYEYIYGKPYSIDSTPVWKSSEEIDFTNDL
jgi:hypothetical protein